MIDIQHNFDQAIGRLTRDIEAYARKVNADLDREFLRQATLLRNDIVIGWPVDTGVSRAAWQGPIKEGFAQYSLRNNVVYSPVIEYGGYRGVGAKTAELGAQFLPGGIQINGGIYPTQRPAAPVRQALSKRILEIERALG